MSVTPERAQTRHGQRHVRGLVQSGTFDRCSTWNRLIGTTTSEQFVLLLQQFFDLSQLAKLIGPLLDRVGKRGLTRLGRGPKRAVKT